MKKRLQIISMIAVFMMTFFLGSQMDSANAATSKVQEIKNVTVVINGEKVTFKDPIIIKSDRILLPMRAFYEAIGANVSWNSTTRIAKAILNGQTIDLTINSKTAVVNGNKIAMSVPALAHKDRTYVPLRFVSENFNGVVSWDQKAKRVDITMNDSSDDETTPTPPKQEEPYIFHINNTRVVMTDPVITKQNRNYIPAEYFYHYIENSSGTWISEDTFQLNIAGNNFIFYANSSNVNFNDNYIVMDAKPFIEKGKMYVPTHFIVDKLGGSLRYQSNIRELYVYLDNYLFTSPVLELFNGALPVPKQIPNANLVDSRDLLISDNPEVLSYAKVPDNESTLSQYHVQAYKTKNEHRVYGWHLNDLGQKVKLGITIENTSSSTPIKITSSKGVSSKSETSRISYEVGLTIADAVFNNKLSQSSSSGIEIQPGETKVIESFDLSNGRIIGFLHDFDVQSVNGGSLDYKVRTVLSKTDGDLTLIHTDPVPTNGVHPRGAWENSIISAEVPAYTLGESLVGYSISNGFTDNLVTAENSLSQTNGAVGNIGHFGMDYKVNIPIINPTGEPKTVKIKLAGRGGIYSGAIKVNGQVYLIPDIKPNITYAELPDITIEGYSQTIQLEVMHAGGGNLPLGIYVEGY
ncbi:MAG TPA: copper amine oxidase N-terminal domain-containing protein [Ureibacillus sp.]|nr:copper amine oxidase N-terminal domain-containing protein [Ureibacillus sp.]